MATPAGDWFLKACDFRDRGQHRKAVQALLIGRKCAIAQGNEPLVRAFDTALSLMMAA